MTSRASKAGVALFAAGAIAIGIAYGATIFAGAAPGWASWFVAFGGSATSVGLFVLGAASRGAVSSAVGLMLAALFVVLMGSFGAALALPATEGPAGPIFLGLPLRLAIVFYGVGFLPLLVLPVAFALTFEKPKAS
jgi:hypothetical protein